MSGPRLLLLACLCAASTRASAQVEDEAQALSQKAASLQSMAGAPRVLLLGDSHTVGTFGHELDAGLRAAYPGWRIETYASCGASPSWYLPGNAASGHTSECGTWFHRYAPKLESVTAASATPLIDGLVASHPDTVIVALGANMANWKKGGIFGMETASALAAKIVGAGSRCLWIGPPDEAGHMPPDQAKAQVARLNAALRASVGEYCRYIESRTTYSGGDGMHYYPEPAKAWAAQATAGVQAALGGRAPAP
jgi:hypothetical protein